MNRNGLKIGEFSRLCRVTVRALRHYEKIKLLVPDIIDYSTGYRYYSVSQMQKALNIVRFKGLGFSLEEIRTMYDSETQRPSINMLEEKIRSCQKQLQLLTECRDRLSAMITFQKKLNEMENIDIEYCEQVAAMGKDSDIIKFKQIPEVAEAVCMKVYGPYGCLNENIRKILEWIEANGYTITYPPRYSYVGGIWNQEDPQKWLTIIRVPVEKS